MKTKIRSGEARDSMVQVFSPVPVVDEKDLLIQEFFGNVASQQRSLSACVVTVKGPCSEAFQRPRFDEYVIVVEGKIELHVTLDGVAPGAPTEKIVTVEAGSSVFLPKGTRVKFVWPGPCKYVPICTPAFTPTNCGREEEEGNTHAKSSACMHRLQQLHEERRHPFLFHVAQKSLWEQAKKARQIYFPPTYEADGFTHMTADPTKLVAVLNHFYKDVVGDWVCLKTNADTLRGAGIKLTFEATAPVGDIEAIDMGDQLFPHLYGGIPTDGVVLEELAVERAADGTFTTINGIFEGTQSSPAVKPLAKATCPYIPASATAATTTITVFSPQSCPELQNAIKACLQQPEGDCFKGPHGPMGEWDVSSVTDMSELFYETNSFNGDISKWDVSSVTDMSSMFSNAIVFNGGISKWDVSSVTDVNSMFLGANLFNGDISKWDVSSVADMSFMFSAAKLFNGDISKWVVSSVTDMNGMFFDANIFNGDISKWDVSSVRNMYAMFYEAASFNGDLSKWKVSRVTDMNSMFARASSFRADISNWDVSSVANMDYMFHEAKSFNLNLCGTAWVHSKASKVGMFGDSSGSISRRVCTRQSMNIVPTRRRASRRPIPDRELIARTSITTAVSSPAIGSLIVHTMACPQCGMFPKSGRASCCAPGGAWFKNCGGASNRNVDHKWSEGVKACKLTTTTTTISACSKCVPIKKSGKTSCCGRGGSWFGNCRGTGNTKLDHTWYEGIQVCQTWAESKIAFGRQSNAAQQLNSPNGAGVANFKTNTTSDSRYTAYSTGTTTTTGTITTALVTLTAKEATIATDWSSHDFFVGGGIFICVILLLLITLTVTGCFFVRKDSTAKKEFPAVPPQPDSDSISKDMNLY